MRRWLSTLVVIASFVCVCGYGGHGAQSAQFRERVDFEPKQATLSPVLPVGEEPYFPPPEIPMPDKRVIENKPVESAESTAKVECGPSPTTTTTEHPHVEGCGSSVDHVEVDSEVSTAPKLVPPPGPTVDEATAGETQPKESVAVAGHKSGSISSGSYSSATKEEAAIYGLGGTASSPGSIPPEATTLPQTVDVVAEGGGAYGPIVQPTPSVQVEVSPSTSAPVPKTKEPEAKLPEIVVSATHTPEVSPVSITAVEAAPPPAVPNNGYEVEVALSTSAPVTVSNSEVELPAVKAPEAKSPEVEAPAAPPSNVHSVSIAAISENAPPSEAPVNNGYEVPIEIATLPPEPTTIEVVTTQSTTTESLPPVQTTEIEVPPAVKGYEEEETPAQQIARVPDNENLYEQIEEVPTTPTVIPSTETTIPYVPPTTSAQTEAPYQPPAPRAEPPLIVDEVESEVTVPPAPIAPSSVPTSPPPAPTVAPAQAPEPYGQRVEAAHIEDETAAGDYDLEAGVPASSSPTASTISSASYNGDGGSGTSSVGTSNPAPSAVPYIPQAPAGPSGNSYTGTSNFGGNSGGYASSIGGSAYPSYVPAPLAQPQYVAPPAFPSFAPAPSSYSSSQQQGCCGGSWFSAQGSLCAPVNYNSCQQQQTSSGCGGGCSSGCGQSSFGFGGSSGCGGCSSGCGCQPACTPCTPITNPCPQPCLPAPSSCCCPSAPAVPSFAVPSFAGFCGGRKKRSIQTVLGLCRKRA